MHPFFREGKFSAFSSLAGRENQIDVEFLLRKSNKFRVLFETKNYGTI